MEKKINVLVIPSDKTGVGKFRSIDPHIFYKIYIQMNFMLILYLTHSMMIWSFGLNIK